MPKNNSLPHSCDNYLSKLVINKLLQEVISKDRQTNLNEVKPND
jgi:hypothetical protein